MTACKIIDKELAKSFMPIRHEQSNKGTYGAVLNFAGCITYPGAAYLSSVAPLRVGAGLVELAAPAFVRERVAALTPDVVFSDFTSYSYINSLPQGVDFARYAVVLTGCGLGNNKYTQKFMHKLIETIKELAVPVIYDADALNIIAQEGITLLGKNVVMTPHPGEMSRLMSVDIAEIQSNREKFALMAAKKYAATVVLKGHHTLIACKDGTLFKDVSGTSVLAKAGMGDVLAGIIAGLCSQGLSTQQAAILGVYIHSQSGVLAEKACTPYGLLASELLKFIPDGIKSIIM